MGTGNLLLLLYFFPCIEASHAAAALNFTIGYPSIQSPGHESWYLLSSSTIFRKQFIYIHLLLSLIEMEKPHKSRLVYKYIHSPNIFVIDFLFTGCNSAIYCNTIWNLLHWKFSRAKVFLKCSTQLWVHFNNYTKI